MDLCVDAGDPVPATDQFLSDAQKVWFKDAPMNNVNKFTVEKVSVDIQLKIDADIRVLQVTKTLENESYFNSEIMRLVKDQFKNKTI